MIILKIINNIFVTPPPFENIIIYGIANKNIMKNNTPINLRN